MKGEGGPYSSGQAKFTFSKERNLRQLSKQTNICSSGPCTNQYEQCTSVTKIYPECVSGKG